MRYPHAIEAEYTREIKNLFADWYNGLLKDLRANGVRIDAERMDILGGLFDNSLNKWNQAMNAARGMVERVARKASVRNAENLAADLDKNKRPELKASMLTEVWLPPNIEAHIADNIALIRSIGVQAHGEIQRLVNDAYRFRWSQERLSEEIHKVGVRVMGDKFTYGRAATIARDQTAKFEMVLTRNRHERAGIKNYIWRAVGDSRTRPIHLRLNKTLRTWGAGVAPGEEINCRCMADTPGRESDYSRELHFLQNEDVTKYSTLWNDPPEHMIPLKEKVLKGFENKNPDKVLEAKVARRYFDLLEDFDYQHNRVKYSGVTEYKLTQVDLRLKKAFIEVTTGKSNRKTGQIEKYHYPHVNSDGRQVILFYHKERSYKPNSIKSLERAGAKVVKSNYNQENMFSDLDSLIERIHK